jgi:hypothetical protein
MRWSERAKRSTAALLRDLTQGRSHLRVGRLEDERRIATRLRTLPSRLLIPGCGAGKIT